MSTNTHTRRDVLKQIGAISTVAAVGTNVSVRSVEATDSGFPELVTTSTIPSGSEVRIEIIEYDSNGEETSSQTETLSGGSETFVTSGFTGDSANTFTSVVELGTGSESPSLESLILRIPELESADLDWKSSVEHTIGYDNNRLQRYAPLLNFQGAAESSFQGMFGYICESDEEETFVCCYWALFDDQGGPPLASAESELGDHHPVYVFVDEETGRVERIVYAGFHLFASELSASEANLVTKQADFATHVVLDVVDQYHYFRHSSASTGTFPDIHSWPDVRDDWVDAEYYDPLDPEAVENPWSMTEDNEWYRDGSTEERFANLWRRCGLFHSGDVDDLKGDGFASVFSGLDFFE